MILIFITKFVLQKKLKSTLRPNISFIKLFTREFEKKMQMTTGMIEKSCLATRDRDGGGDAEFLIHFLGD